VGFGVLPWRGCRDNTVIMDSAREEENAQEGGARSRKVRGPTKILPKNTFAGRGVSLPVPPFGALPK